MNMDPNTEDAADARHEPRNPFFAEPGDHIGNASREHGPSIEMPERGKAQHYHPGGYVTPIDSGADGHYVPEAMRVTEVPPAMYGRHGLQWRGGPGFELQDIGRSFTNPEVLEDMHEVDLRTILAHLDAAARGVMRELDVRGLGGRAGGR